MVAVVVDIKGQGIYNSTERLQIRQRCSICQILKSGFLLLQQCDKTADNSKWYNMYCITISLWYDVHSTSLNNDQVKWHQLASQSQNAWTSSNDQLWEHALHQQRASNKESLCQISTQVKIGSTIHIIRIKIPKSWVMWRANDEARNRNLPLLSSFIDPTDTEPLHKYNQTDCESGSYSCMRNL